MKKIYLTLVLVLASMMVVAEPNYKFMSGHSIEGGFQMAGAMGSLYESNHSGINGASYDASIYGGAGLTEGHGYGVTRGEKVRTGVGGGQSLGTMGSIGGRGNGGYAGGGASGAGSGSGFDNPFTTSDGITLGMHGKEAEIGDDLIPWIDFNGTYQPPMENPIGDALVPLMLMILAFAGVVYFRRR